MKRFVDQGILSYHFIQFPIWVTCSFCQKPAQITQVIDAETNETQCIFSCLHCCKQYDYQQNSYQMLDHYPLIEARIDQKCECKLGHYRYLKTFRNKSQIPAFIELTCNICETTKKIAPHISKDIIHTEMLPKWNTFFDHTLWLTEETRLGKIYVYNKIHLQYLKAYIEADLRERTYLNVNKTYFNRLPAWIKSARHRKEVLKAISRLEEKLKQVESA